MNQSNDRKDNVVKLIVKPKRVTSVYRNARIILTFNPESRRWWYTIIVPIKMKFNSLNEEKTYTTERRALSFAKRAVDGVLDGDDT